LIQSNPEQARLLLLENPQFAFALLQAQIILGMINPQTAKVSSNLKLKSLLFFLKIVSESVHFD
jgi:hypothetical protein